MKKKNILMLMLLLVTSLSYAFPKVYPSVIEMKIDSGRSRGEFTIFNSEKEVKKYKLGIKEKDNLGNPSDFSKYLKVFPKYVEIKPGGSQTIRVFAKGIPKNEFDIGEVRASISIEEIKSQAHKKYESKESINGVRTMIDFNYVLNMAVYGYVGDLKSKLKIDSLTLNKKGELTGVITNEGNYSYPLIYEILNKSGKVVEKGSLGKILFGKSLKIKLKTLEKNLKIQIKEGNKKDILYQRNVSL